MTLHRWCLPQVYLWVGVSPNWVFLQCPIQINCVCVCVGVLR